MVSFSVAAGCTYDFKGFPTDPASTSPDVGADAARDLTELDVAVVDLGTDSDSDLGVEDLGGDVGVPNTFGDQCADDGACAGLMCIRGICTVACDAGTACPGDAQCDAGSCVAPCGAQRACQSGFSCLSSGAGCLPDGDADGTPDSEDNCVMMSNADQRDADDDAIGDACDADPWCPDGHVDGVWSSGSIAWPATAPSLPEYAGGWVLAAGGFDAGTPVSLLGSFGPGASAVAGMLPYSATAFGLAQLGSSYLLTPGDLGTVAQFGRTLIVARDGSVGQGAPFVPAARRPVMSAGPGGVSYVAAAGGTAYEFFTYDGPSDRYVSLGRADDGVAIDWHVTRDHQGVSTFYSSLIDPITRSARIATMGPDATRMNTELVFYPDADGSFDPLLSPAPGGRSYVWDRATGRGFVWDGLDFKEFDELRVASPWPGAVWLSHPAGGVHFVGGADGANELGVASMMVACLPAAAGIDSDQDGVSDPRDLCPDDGLGSGPDLDGDRIGDACDVDADGDGVLDTVDVSIGDTDDDGTANDFDDDDDGDGVVDALDRWPLDTDNDAIPNAVDLDDDGDGFLDDDERSAGTGVLDPLHFPGSGTVAWVEGGVVKWALLGQLGAAEELERAGALPPTSVRFDPTGQAIQLVAGTPGTTSTVEFTALGGSPTVIDVGATIWGADVISSDVNGPTELLLAHDSAVGDVDLSVFRTATSEFRTLVSVLTKVESPDISGGIVVFTAQPQGCDNCRSAYEMNVGGPIPRIVAPMVSHPSTIRYNDGAITLLGDASDMSGDAAWFGEPADPIELRPPDAIDVTGAVGYPDGYVLVAATHANGSSLWLWNGANHRWLELIATSEAVVELDWAR